MVTEMHALPEPFALGEIPTAEVLSDLSSVLMDMSEFHLKPLTRTICATSEDEGLTDEEFGRVYRSCLAIRDAAEWVMEDLAKVAVAASEATGAAEAPLDENGYVTDAVLVRNLQRRIGFGGAS